MYLDKKGETIMGDKISRSLHMPCLYKLDSSGRIRAWNIEMILTASGVTYYTQKHGLLNGKMQETSTFVVSGKNIGKANETTPWEQCQSEALSLWQKQKDRKGYSEVVPTSKPLRPMLAQKYDSSKMPEFKSVCVQPKLDGIRCLAYLDGNQVVLVSRQGKRFTALKHIEDSVYNTLRQHPEVILDGELYSHQYRDNFQVLVSAIKRDDPSVDSKFVQYHIYDMISNIDFIWRSAWLEENVVIDENIWLVNTDLAVGHNSVLECYSRYIDMGYEGIMVREQLGEYEINKRSKYLLKHKEFMDDEFEIVDAYENKGKQEGQCTLICRTKEGATFGVKPKGTDAEREKYWVQWKNGELRGKKMTVRFFAWTTSTPSVPRFPVGIAIRDFE